MTNFDFLLSCDKAYAPFAEKAIAAEKIYSINTASCVLTCRVALEDGVKWMYSVDHDLEPPQSATLVNLLMIERSAILSVTIYGTEWISFAV